MISADGRHTVLFMVEGSGEIEISGRRFSAGPRTGVYVRPSEAYRVHNAGSATVKFLVSNGPGSEDLHWLNQMPTAFEDDYPHRDAPIDPAQRHKMAERYYQMLVNREHGSTVVTQFIGNIPQSKAEPHRHLYEEALIFLNGAGVVWTEKTKTPLRPATYCSCQESSCIPCSARRPAVSISSASSIPATIPRLTTELRRAHRAPRAPSQAPCPLRRRGGLLQSREHRRAVGARANASSCPTSALKFASRARGSRHSP